MRPSPSISVVIPAHQAESTIDRCLKGLEQQTVPRQSYEVLVVDDGSYDGTRARVLDHAHVCLLSQSRAGPAVARNLGLQKARGDIVLFTDADCQPVPDWIERMVEPFHDVLVAGVKGAYLGSQREIVARFAQIEYEDRYDRMARREFIDFVDTYAAGYRRDILLACGGFDPGFATVSVEDQELSFRLAEQGLKLVFVPQARVYHLNHPPDLKTYFQRKFRIGYWKVTVTRMYPGKLLSDSHTPQILKLQILLVGVGLLCLLGGLLWSPLLWGSVLSGLLFLASTLPFVLKAWRKDPQVALVSPALLFARALALGTGFCAGLCAWLGSFGSSRADQPTEEEQT
jgi:glycosyltransferase involved in cell wall biosynthesis